MMYSIPARPALASLAAITLLGLASCSKLVVPLLPNQAPEVRLTAAPLVKDSSLPFFYAYTIRWVGFDPDGQVTHYVYAVDPESLSFSPADTAWHTTVKNEQDFFFSADSTITPVDLTDPRSEAPHTFALYAVDNHGTLSARPAVRSFYSYTQAPYAFVTEPRPNEDFAARLTPSVRLRWSGTDPDGQFTTKPVRWVFRLFTKINPDLPMIGDFVNFAQLYPDSIRKIYEPGSNELNGACANFKGWNRAGADTTSFQYTGLPVSTPENPEYLFVVTGFDEAGAYDPIFDTSKNMLRFSVNFASSAGPIIRMYTQFFDYTYPDGGLDESEARWFKVEVPADIPLTFNWQAFPAPGADLKGTRWGLDLVDLDDDTPRREESDWREKHWSAWSSNTSATIGPFTQNGEFHLFYIEAEDNNRLRSLGTIAFTVIKADWPTAKSLLIVDDTRMAPDLRQNPNQPIDGPVGAWPTAAELDTFLYARGGYPWKARAPGTLSTPGIFNGYDFDTLGTRNKYLDGVLPLSTLVQYRHIVWMVDPKGATYINGPTDFSTPTTSLRLVNSPNRPAVLAAYMFQGFKTEGGNVWLLGGGAAYATLAPWNKEDNGPSTFSRSYGELQEGRLMFDYSHWREEITTLPATRADKFGDNTGAGAGEGSNRPGRGWPPNPIPPTPPAPPNYAILPAHLMPKSGLDDPLPPGRENDGSNFYAGIYTAEHISQPSYVFEDYDDSDQERIFSTLDTLYMTRGGTATRNSPVMTYYHGRDCQPFVFSGFNIWYWRRPDCIALVDFVLGSVWGLPRDPNAPRGPSASGSRRRAAP